MQVRRSALLVLSLGLLAHGILEAFFGKTLLVPRSQSIDAVRDLVGWQQLINRADADCNYWSLAITPTYMRTFDNCGLTRYLLGSDFFTFSGSLVENRKDTDILADYFGLPLDFKSNMSFNPVISQFMMDFNLYYGLDNISRGLYLRIHAPIVHANWDLNVVEVVSSPGEKGFPSGYMSNAHIIRQDLPETIEDTLEGTETFGDLQEPLKFGKIFNREQKTGLADLQLIFGKNFWLGDCYHAGINARLYFPVGSKVTSEFLLDPILGNGKHWELGFGFTGHYTLDYDWCASSIYCDANITHLCPARQLRSYDFKNNRGSRYMLLELMQENSASLFVDGAAASRQYERQLSFAINKTTLCTTIDVAVQADIVVKWAWTYNNWEVDFGYNFWARSAERLKCRQKFPSDVYAFKGDAQIYGFTAGNSPIALETTQSKATLFGGQGAGNFVSGAQLQNNNADNAAQAFGPTSTTPLFNTTTTFEFPHLPVKTSSTPILLTDNDIDECSALSPRGISNKLFANISYTWWHDTLCMPYLGVGGDIEWARTSMTSNSALSQWGVWLKGGIAC